MARSASDVFAGVGLLYCAPVSATAPLEADIDGLNVLTDLGAGWREIGYTEAGSTTSTATTSEPLEVAEEIEPIGLTITGRTGSISFIMVQATVDNLGLALNRGAGVLKTVGKITPPDLEDELYVQILLQTPQGAVWHFPKTKNSAEFSLARAKTGKTGMAVQMDIFKETGKDFFAVFPGPNGEV